MFFFFPRVICKSKIAQIPKLVLAVEEKHSGGQKLHQKRHKLSVLHQESRRVKDFHSSTSLKTSPAHRQQD